jgi:hypothetical protein
MTAQMPPGWYDDPDGSPNAERRWDGHNWTPERRKKTTHTPPPAYPQPPQAQAWYPQTPQAQAWHPLPGRARAWYPQPPQGQGVVSAAYPAAAVPAVPAAGAGSACDHDRSNLFSIIAFVCGVLPWVSPYLVVFGCWLVSGSGLAKKERLAPFAIAAAVGGTILGWIFQAILWSSFY